MEPLFLGNQEKYRIIFYWHEIIFYNSSSQKKVFKTQNLGSQNSKKGLFFGTIYKKNLKGPLGATNKNRDFQGPVGSAAQQEATALQLNGGLIDGL